MAKHTKNLDSVKFLKELNSHKLLFFLLVSSLNEVEFENKKKIGNVVWNMLGYIVSTILRNEQSTPSG